MLLNIILTRNLNCNLRNHLGILETNNKIYVSVTHPPSFIRNYIIHCLSRWRWNQTKTFIQTKATIKVICFQYSKDPCYLIAVPRILTELK